MKIFKTFGSIVGLYIVLKLLMTMLIPNTDGWLSSLLDIILIFSLILAVFSLILGGKNRGLKSISRTMGLIAGLAIVTVITAMLLAQQEPNTPATVIINVIPFGKPLESILKIILVGALQDNTLPTPVELMRDFAKLFLQTALNPIITGILFSFLFAERGVNESESNWTKRNYTMFMNPDQIYDKKNKIFSVRGAVARVFGIVYSAFSAIFIFNGLVYLLIETLKINETIISGFLMIVVIGFMLIIYTNPLLYRSKHDSSEYKVKQRDKENILRKLLASLIKMFTLNVIVILIFGSFSGIAT